MVGQVIYKKNCFDDNIEIDISEFKNGLYLLKIKSNNVVSIKKILKL